MPMQGWKGLCIGGIRVCLGCRMNSEPSPPPPLPGGCVFEAHEVRKVYHTGEVEVVALHGVDVALDAGELVVLLGPSGSGKSTLLNILGGLDVATSGELIYKGWALDGAEENALTLFRRNCVGFVFQFYNLIPSLTARENVALITGIARDPMTPEEALEMVGLHERMEHTARLLSGGEMQRVAIARAIALPPRLLAADEPTGNLDRAAAEGIMECLRTLNQRGVTILLVTHNETLLRHCSRRLHLEDGRIFSDRLNGS